jgi:hypothetical protein
MTDFRDALRTELVAAAARPLPRRHALPRTTLVRGAALAAAVAAAAIAVLVVPWGADRKPAPALQPNLPGRPLFGGSLEDGVRYRTRALHPQISFRVTGDRWFLQDATAHSDLLLQFREGEPAQGTEMPPVLFLAFLRMPSVIDPGTGEVVPAPRDVVGWLRRNPDLGITSVTRTRVLGRPASRLVFHVPAHPARVDPGCRFTRPAVPGRLPRTGPCAAIAPNVSPAAGSSGRLLVPDGADPLIVAQGSLIPSRVGQAVRVSAPLIASVQVGR